MQSQPVLVVTLPNPPGPLPASSVGARAWRGSLQALHCCASSRLLKNELTQCQTPMPARSTPNAPTGNAGALGVERAHQFVVCATRPAGSHRTPRGQPPLPLAQARAPCQKGEVVEDDGIEPTTPCLQSRCSPS